MPPTYPRCPYCSKALPTQNAVRLHVSSSLQCSEAWKKQFNQNPPKRCQRLPLKPSFQCDGPDTPSDDEMETIADNIHLPLSSEAPIDPLYHRPASPTPPARAARGVNEEIRGVRYSLPYPRSIANPISLKKTRFEVQKDCYTKAGASPWHPFLNQDDWELARWLLNNVNQKATEKYLKLPMVSDTVKKYPTRYNEMQVQNNKDITFKSNYHLMKAVDKLSTGPGWTCEIIDVAGDKEGEEGGTLFEDLELWRRDPVECVNELIGNPAFKDYISYIPEWVYTDDTAQERIYDEMWTSDWWWKTQDKLPNGTTIAPVILASDKTQLSRFQGDKSAWPLYLTIGNISKEIRRQPSAHATILVAYLPIAKLQCYSEENRSLAKYRLFHYCMSKILSPMVEAGQNGVEMVCADGFVRIIYPVLAAYVADYPEQCLVACCMENRCPRCVVSPSDRSSPFESLSRDINTTLRTLKQHSRGYSLENFGKIGLRAVYEPFWANLPYCDIFACFTPDLLHQLHKGLFKDHLVSWCTTLIGKSELDARFKAMSAFPGLRHFKNGISSVTQWTGTEHKEMEKVFVSLMAGAVNGEVLTIIRAILDFIFYAQLQLHTTKTLKALDTSLKTFHAHKDLLINLEIHQHFNIPKLHAIIHYLTAIQALGSTDGYNSESPERLHIEFAKEGYRASNKRDYLEQMAVWLQRREAIWTKESYLMWLEDKVSPIVCDRDGDGEDDNKVDVENETSTTSTEVNNNSFSATSTRSGYTLAKKAAFPNMSIEKLVTDYGAEDFLPALTTFLREHVPQCKITPNNFDRFDIFKQILITSPPNFYLNNQSWTYRLRSTPAVKPKGRKSGTPGRFDTALIAEQLGDRERVASLEGLRVGQIRVIFTLPVQFTSYPHPLAYVEWFTPLGHPDKLTGMHIITRSTKLHCRNVAIISVERIVRSCHLVGKCGLNINNDWRTDNVLDLATHFYVNPYINVDSFTAFKC